ncbi:MAG TPA: lysoplasmalogenase family protein [Bacilli bacterium]|nr:lysoplasmalogenase family protein [Bacilli bacterium]
MLPITSYIFLGLFGLSTVIHLFFAFKEDEPKRKITKPFNLLFLALFALIALRKHPLIYIGAFMGMIGDIFLINNKNKRFFITGALFFLAGHLFYISEILFVILKDRPVDNLFYIVVPLAILLFTSGGFFVSKKICSDNATALVGTLYLAILLTVTTVAIVASVKGFVLYMFLGIIGGVLFLLSDLILTQATYIKDFKRRDFYIMLTYLLGQLFIVLSLVLTVIL